MRNEKLLTLCRALALAMALSDMSSAAAMVQPALKWGLTEYATLSNGILTVDVPKDAKPGLYGATAYVGLEPFEGRSLGAKVMASGERVAVPGNSCHGLKLMLHFTAPGTGDECWPDAPHRTGSWPKAWLEVADTLSGGTRSAWGTIHVGLQGTSGKVVFDMNTFEVTSGESLYPRVNGDYRVAYPESVAKRPQLRGVQLPAGHSRAAGVHGGGDEGLMEAFINALYTGDRSKILSGPDVSLESHLMVFAAERSRRNNTVETIR